MPDSDGAEPEGRRSHGDLGPEKGTGEENVGVNVAARSNLAYDRERLAYTSMSKPFAADSHYYNIESVSAAILNYYATDELDAYDTDGSQSRNMSRLGVNGRTSTEDRMPIHSEADYNVGVLDNWNQGKKLRVRMILSKKTDTFDAQDTAKVVGADYVQVDAISNYLDSVGLSSGETAFVKKDDLSSAKEYVYEADCASCQFTDGYYHFNVAFTVKTGEGFKEYANYQVYLVAELLDESGQAVEGSGARDYIVYTNAKVFPEVLN